MVKPYFEKSALSVIISWSGRVSILLVIGGSGRVGSVTENGPVDISVTKSVFLKGVHGSVSAKISGRRGRPPPTIFYG